MQQVLFRIPLKADWLPFGVPLWAVLLALFLAAAAGLYFGARHAPRWKLDPKAVQSAAVWVGIAGLIVAGLGYFFARSSVCANRPGVHGQVALPNSSATGDFAASSERRNGLPSTSVSSKSGAGAPAANWAGSHEAGPAAYQDASSHGAARADAASTSGTDATSQTDRRRRRFIAASGAAHELWHGLETVPQLGG